MVKQFLLICGCLSLSLIACRNAGNEQGRDKMDTASSEKLQEGPQDAHTPMNEPQNRTSAPDSSSTGSNNMRADSTGINRPR